VRGCVADAVAGNDAVKADQRLDELMEAVRRFSRARP
jgi:hypothetical protein